MPLTNERIDEIIKNKIDKKRQRHHDGGGLYLVVKAPTNARWAFRYQKENKHHEYAIGSLKRVPPKEARKRAMKLGLMLADGIDPVAERRKQQSAQKAEKAKQVTFKAAAQQCFDKHKDRWSEGPSRDQFMASLQNWAFPIIGGLAVGDITKAHVLRVLEQDVKDADGNILGEFWSYNPETASRVRIRIEQVLSYSTVHEWRTGENPARWRGYLDQVLLPKGKIRKVKHHRRLHYQDVPSFMAAMKLREGVTPKAIRFLVLTATRTSEVTGALKTEIDRDNAIWNIPGERMKNGLPHRVPLVKEALEILDELTEKKNNLTETENNPYLFVGPKDGLSNMAMTLCIRRAGYGDKTTIHGFRSSFRDYCEEATSTPREISELCLAHVNKDKTEAAYLRSDLLVKRRKLMEKWAGHCNRPVGTPSVVVEMKKTA